MPGETKTTYKIADDTLIAGITAGKVRAAASACTTANTTLRTLFPQVFEKLPPPLEREIMQKDFDIITIGRVSVREGYADIQPRINGNLTGQGYYLGTPPYGWRWEIVKDDFNFQVLTLVKND